MDFPNATTTLPLHTDSEGIVRVGGTRIALESVLAAFKNGSTCEEIVFQFPVLELGDVYAVIGFYLQNLDEMERYLEKSEQEAARLQKQVEAKFPSDTIRTRLLKRRGAASTSA